MKINDKVIIKPEIMFESNGLLEGSSVFNQTVGVLLSHSKGQWQVKWDTGVLADVPPDKLMVIE